MRNSLVFLFVVLWSLTGFSQTHFISAHEGTNASNYMNIWVTSGQIGGVNLQTGDEIGVFDGNICVGTKLLTGEFISTVTVTAAETDAGLSNGYTAGHSISVKVWDSSESMEYVATVEINPDSPYSVFTNQESAYMSISVKKPLTLSLTAQNKEYDGSDAATVGYAVTDGTISGDVTVSVTDGKFSDKNIGYGKTVSASIVVSGADAVNFDITLINSTTANITAKSLTIVNAVAQNKSYDGGFAAQITGAALSGIIAPDVVTLANAGTGTFSQSGIGTGIAVSTAMSITGINSGNYTLSAQPSGLNANITSAVLTVTANSVNKDYDGLVYSDFTSNITGYVNGESGSVISGSVTYSGSAITAVNAGSYTIIPVVSGLIAANYSFTPADGTLTIGKVVLTVTADNQSKTYDNTVFSPFTSTITGYVNSENSSVVLGLVTYSGTATTAKNVGITVITPVVSGLTATNYSFVPVTGNLEIIARTINVTADSKSKTYGEADPVLSYTFTPDLIGLDTFSGALTRNSGESAQQFDINQGTLILSSNYTLIYTGAKLTINKKIITATAVAKTKVYGESDPELTYTYAPALIGTDSFTGLLSRLPGENAGTFAINKGTLALSDNYTLNYTPATLTISKKPILVKADPKGKAFGGIDPELTYTNVPALIGSDTFTGSLSRVPGEALGNYDIEQGSLVLNSNYILTFEGASLTIGVITINVTANEQNKTYGETDPELTFTYSPELIEGDVFTGSLSRVAGSDVGTYAIERNNLALNNNYVLNFTGANLTIQAKEMNVTATASSKTFGDADPVLTYSHTPELVSGDSFSGTLSRAEGENVGDYIILVNDLSLGNNYILNFTEANFRIETKSIHVTAEAKSKVYGETDPALTYTYEPELIGDDAFSGALSRIVGESVGTHLIIQNDLALSSNYTVTFSGANLSISKRLVTVTVNTLSKIYGSTDPVLTTTVIPALVGTDTFSGLLERAPGESVGNYAITQGSLLLSSNYAMSFVPASLTITKADLTIKASDQSKCEGTAQTFDGTEYTTTGLVTGDVISGLSLTSDGITADAGAGTYDIIASNAVGSGFSNYNMIYAKGVLTVNALPVPTITGLSVACAGATQVIYTTEEGMVDYNWTVSSGGTIMEGSGTNTVTVNWNEPGIQSISVMYSNTSACSNSTTQPVEINPLPTAVITGGTTICSGTTTTLNIALTGTAPWSITFSDGENQTTVNNITENSYSLEVSPLSNTTVTYSVTNVSDFNGCSNTGSEGATVKVLPNNETTIVSNSKSLCYGSADVLLTATLASEGKVGIQWQKSVDNTIWTDIDHANGLTYAPGALYTSMYYKVVSTVENCGSQSSNIEKITVLEPITNSKISTSQTICCFGSIPEKITATIPSGGSGVFTYQWQQKNS